MIHLSNSLTTLVLLISIVFSGIIIMVIFFCADAKPLKKSETLSRLKIISNKSRFFKYIFKYVNIN